MKHFMTDARHALRGLRKAPLFTTLAVVSLGLGIGSNTAIFTLLDQILLRPLPIDQPHELVQLRIQGGFFGNTVGNGTEISYPMYLDFRDNNQVFAGMFARFDRPMNVAAAGSTERTNGELVSGTYFSVLGVRPAHGRLFTPDDDRVQGAHQVAVLSHRYWRNRFRSNPDLIGQKITVNDHPLTVIGVAGEGFDGLDLGRATDVFVPMMMKPQMTPGVNDLDERRSRFARVFARLRPGITREQAETSLQPYFRALREQELTDPDLANLSAYSRREFRNAALGIIPGFQGTSGLRESLTDPLWILMVIVAAVLLIACANVAGLLIARGMSRQREIAIRLALGASRVRVAQQLLVESLILALLGGAAGLLVATWGAAVLLAAFSDPEAAVAVSPSPDARILAFNVGLVVLTALLFGVAPALEATRPPLAPALKEQAGPVIGGGQVRLRKLLVIAQVALSLLLLIGAGLFVRSLGNLLSEDPGFETTNLVSFVVEPSLNGYSHEPSKQLATTLVERVQSLPGVTSASAAGERILTGGSWNSSMTLEGHAAKEGEEVYAYNNSVLPGYFGTLRIPLLLGRDFTLGDRRPRSPADSESSFRVAIANQRFVELYIGDSNPIGRHVGFGSAPGTPTPIEIVGVVGTAKYRSIRGEAEPQLFFPLLEDDYPRPLTVYARTTQPSSAIFPALRRAVREVDPDLPLFETRTMSEQVNRSLRNERLIAGLSAVFGLLATLLAVVGLYGVMAYAVSRRTREVGIRMALGAVPAMIGWQFIREAALLVLWGFALALPLLWALGQYVRSQLYGIEALNLATIAAAMLALGAIAGIGTLVPAWRAARIQPVVALREE